MAILSAEPSGAARPSRGAVKLFIDSSQSSVHLKPSNLKHPQTNTENRTAASVSVDI